MLFRLGQLTKLASDRAELFLDFSQRVLVGRLRGQARRQVARSARSGEVATRDLEVGATNLEKGAFGNVAQRVRYPYRFLERTHRIVPTLQVGAQRCGITQR